MIQERNLHMEGMEFWKVNSCFGQAQAEKILSDPKWRKIYPSVFDALNSENDKIKYHTLIPMQIVRLIAAVQPEWFIFAFCDDELISPARVDLIRPGFTRISSLEALNMFGGDAMREAVDYGTSKIEGKHSV